MLRDGQPFFLDYQGGRRGALHYDIASLLYDAKADLPPALRQQLLELYLATLAQFVELTREHCCPRRGTPVAWSAENTRLGGTPASYLGGGLRFELSLPVQVIPAPG
jgi:hypothetical protein